MSKLLSNGPPFVSKVALQEDDLVMCVDGRGRIVFCNENLAQVLGREAGVLVGQPFGAVVPVQALAEAGTPFDVKHIIGGRDFAAGFESSRADGSAIALYMYGTAGIDPGTKKPAGVVCIAREVTGYWRAERRLKLTEEKYRRLLDSSSDIVLLTDTRGRISEANTSARRLLGFGDTGYTGSSLLDFVLPERRRVVETEFANLEKQRQRRIALEIATGAGDRRVLELDCSALEMEGRSYLFAIGRDVTERLRMEKVLRESEQKYREIFASVRDGMLLESLDGQVLDANQGAGELLGYSPGELVGRSALDLVPPETRVWFPQIRETLLNKHEYRGEGLNVRKDGSQVPVEVRCSLTETGTAEPKVLVLLHDITERREAERALQESEENFRALADNANDGILIAVGKGRHVYANPRAAEITGYSVSELLRTTMGELGHPDDASILQGRYDQRLRGEPVPNQYEARIVAKHGKVVPIELTAARTRWKSQPADLVVLRDVTERKEAERALHESEEKYRNLVERAADGICIIQDAILEYVNPRLAQLAGYTVDELTGSPFINHVVQPEQQWVVERYRRRMAGEQVDAIYETTLVRKDRSLVEVELNAGIITYHGRPADLVFVRDITERRRAEQEVNESRRRLGTLMGNLPGMAYRCRNDRDWTVEFVSQGSVQLTGYRPGELVGNRVVSYASLIHPRDRALVWDEVQAALKERQPFELRYRIVAKGGRERWVWEQGQGVLDNEGNLLALEGFITDITELRQTEEDLRESRERYRTLFMSTPLGVYRTTPDGWILMANPAIVAMLGYSSFDELRSRNLVDAEFHPAYDRREFERRIETEGEISGLEANWVRKDGSAIRVRENARLVRDEQGKPLYYDGTVEDITAKEEALDALRDREARLRLLVEQFPAVMWTTDRELRFTSSVGAGLADLGLKPGQVVGMSLYEYFGTGDPNHPPIRSHRQALSGGTTMYTLEWSGRTFETTVEPLRDASGNVIGTLGLAQDTTERLKAERGLVESEHRYRSLFDLAPDGVAVYRDGNVILANRACARILGYDSPDDIVGRPAVEFVHPDDRELVNERNSQLLQGEIPDGVSGPLRVRFLRKDGTALGVEVMGSISEWHGGTAVQVFVRPRA